MENPEISVILPFYNAERYIGRAVSSILSCGGARLELIAVNDGSSDGSPGICKAIAERDGRLRIIECKRGGVSRARNAGLAAARGEYVGFLDADDLAMPMAHEYMLREAKKYDADIVQCAVIFEYDGVQSLLFSPKSDELYLTESGGRLKHLSNSCWSKLYRRELIKNLNFPEDITVGEDLCFNIRAIAAAERLLFLKKPLYRYVQRKDSAMHSLLGKRRGEEMERALKLCEREAYGKRWLLDYIRSERVRNFAHVFSLTSGKNDEYCKELFAKMRKNAKISLGDVVFCRGVCVRKKAGILLAVLSPRLYRIFRGRGKNGGK